jgi:hypothetical protein
MCMCLVSTVVARTLMDWYDQEQYQLCISSILLSKPDVSQGFIHTAIMNQSWTMLVSVLAGYQGGPSYLSLVPLQFCNQNQVPSLSLDGISTWSKGGPVVELDWNHPLVVALHVTRTRPEVQFQTCFRIRTRLKFFYEFCFGFRESFLFWKSWGLLEEV